MDRPTIKIPPRHGQMFELLRQTHQADKTSRRIKRPEGPSKQDHAARAFQALAVRSLDQRAAPSTSAPRGTMLHSFLV